MVALKETVRVTCRDRWLNWRQVIEEGRLIALLAKHSKTSYANRKPDGASYAGAV